MNPFHTGNGSLYFLMNPFSIRLPELTLIAGSGSANYFFVTSIGMFLISWGI